MPLTSKGEKILGHMEQEYGSKKKAEEVFYASKNKGTISGVDSTRADCESYMDACRRGDGDALRNHPLHRRGA